MAGTSSHRTNHVFLRFAHPCTSTRPREDLFLAYCPGRTFNREVFFVNRSSPDAVSRASLDTPCSLPSSRWSSLACQVVRIARLDIRASSASKVASGVWPDYALGPLLIESPRGQGSTPKKQENPNRLPLFFFSGSEITQQVTNT